MAWCQLDKSDWGRQLHICPGIEAAWLPELVIQLSAASALEASKLWFPSVFCFRPRRGCKAGEDGWETAEAEGRVASLGV